MTKITRKLLQITAACAAMLAGSALWADQRPVAMIIAQGGLGDGSWNDTANAGFQSGLKATGLEGKTIESADVVAQGEEIMRRGADGGS
jgi:basic membrane protein A and related proteins